jgi:hypothetical protein
MSAGRYGLSLLVICILAACAGRPAAEAPPVHGQAVSAPVAAPLDPSYDWRGLVLMPFGTLLKESPVALHEVLLFHDEARANSAEFGKDCFTVEGKPRLADHEVQEFLLCFAHDRLDRIEASALMKSGEGPTVLARACALWLQNAAPAAGAVGCEGHDGNIAFSAHLGGVPSDGGDTPGAVGSGSDFLAQPSILSVVVSHPADRGITSEP